MIERKALIFNIQKYNMYDGPGVRTIVFFKGCPLRCQWCSNPESQLRRFDILFKKNSCVHCGACAAVCPTGVQVMNGKGEHEVVRDAQCIGCRKCEEVCAPSALAVSGEVRSVSELLAIIEEDKPFYNTSGGGLTIGGGEVLVQPEAAANLLMATKQVGINTAIETCGYARQEALACVAEFTDLFLYDVKHVDSKKHYRMTGVHNDTILDNLQWLLENRHAVTVRVPLLKGFNDDDASLQGLIRFLEPYLEYKNFKGIDLLPYHKMGVNKYSQLDREYPLTGDPVPTDADLERIERILRQCGARVSVIRH